MKSLRYELGFIPLPVARFIYRGLKPGDVKFLVSLYENQNQMIYLHIPKAGGNSIEKSLGLMKSGHKPLKLFELALDSRQFDTAFKFTFVRDPWTRLASAYYYLKSGKGSPEDIQWATQNLSIYDTFEAFVKEYVNPDSVYSYIHLIPQAEYLKNWAGEINIDFIGYLNNIQEDFQRLLKFKGPIARKLEHKNPTQGGVDYMQEYDHEMIEIVSKACRQDISAFEFQVPA